MIRIKELLFVILLSAIVSSCNDTVERLKRVGRVPEFEKLTLPTMEEDEEEKERRNDRNKIHHAHMRKTNSLWQPGSSQFFRDSRAWNVGDIIRVIVQIQDNASLNNSTKQNRTGSDKLGIPNLFGKEEILKKSLFAKANLSTLVSTSTNRAHSGNGNISRKESVNTEIAATVTKILPNGNLVIQGRQEVRVNYELREVKVAGIIRPKDITSENSIMTNQIAEARISYGGRGAISDVQQPRVGSQILDVISPF